MAVPLVSLIVVIMAFGQFAMADNRYEIFDIPGKQLFYSSAKLNWEDAQKRCQNLGGKLVHLRNDKENRQIDEIMRAVGKVNATNRIWIGAHDKEFEGLYRWQPSRTKVCYTNWDNGQPIVDGRKECVAVHGKNNNQVFWANYDCRDRHAFVCENLNDLKC